MPAVSKKQQKFFGIVRAIQKGEMAPTTPETAKAAADMKKGDVKKFASTKHKGLPEKKKIVEDKQVKKIIKQLRKSVKSHEKQADTLEKKVKTFKESAFTNITVGNKIGQTFQHATGATITLDNTMSDPSDLPSQVTLDLGFGDTITVDAPTTNEYGIAGITSSLGNAGGGGGVQTRQPKKSADEINQQLDASQEASGVETAKVEEIKDAPKFDENLTLEEKKVEVENYKNAMKEYDKKSAEISRENVRRRKSNVSKVRSFVSKFGANLDTIKGVQTFMKITQGGKKLVVIHQNNMFRDFSDKFNVRVYEAKEGKKISKLTGNFGRVDGSMFDNPFTNRKSSGEATIMYNNVGGEVENRMFEIKDIETTPIKMPIPPKFMEKNMSKGWQPSTTSSFDQEFIDKMKIFAGKNFVSSLAGSNFAAQLSVQLAQGDLTPVTKSPGPVVTNLIIQNISDNLQQGNSRSDKLGTNSYWDAKSGKGAIRYDMYKGFSVKMAPVSASLGQYSIERTDKGIRIIDNFDISSGFTAPGGAAYFSPLTQLVGGKDVQSTGETLTAIAARRAAELGYDMVDADTGETLQPIYAGEEEFNSRNYPNAGAPTIATPKGYNIKIDFTIPWSSFSPQTANLLKIGGKQIVNPLPNKTSSTDSDVFDRDDASFKKSKKQKGIKESKLSFELIQQFKDGSDFDRSKKLKEQTTFAQMQERIRNAKEKRREQQKKSEKLYMDTKRKGVKFYDKKGTGRLKDGKKIYD